MNKKVLSLFIAAITTLTSFNAVMAETSYTDVAETAPYAEAVEYCRENGLMPGTSDTEFSPDVNTSRAMLVTILHRYENSPEVSGTISFSDVEDGSWYYDAVCWAADTGIIEGYDAEHFGPLDTLTKEQILSVLWRIDGEEQISNTVLPYSDTQSISSYAVNAINWAYTNEIIDAESYTLKPQSAVTRSDMAVILYRYLTMSQDASEPTATPDNTDEPIGTEQSDTVVPDVHVRFDTTEFDVVLYDSATKDLLMSQLSESEMMLPPSYDMYDISAMGNNMSSDERNSMITGLSEQRWTDFENGMPAYARTYPADAPLTEFPADLTGTNIEWWTFYAMKRGWHPNSGGAFTNTSSLSFANYSLLNHIDDISPRPIMFITGDIAHSRSMSEEFYEMAEEPKDLL